jgi:hypothetical protein
MTLTFGKLKEISAIIEMRQDDKFCSFLNEFEGDTIHEKFKTILKLWEYHVSDTITFALDGKEIILQISYLLNQLSENLNDNIIIEDNDNTYELGIPNVFSFNETDSLPIYDILKNIKISDISLNLLSLSKSDKRLVINRLPAKVFSKITEHLAADKSKIYKLDNPALNLISINFYTNAPYIFLRGLFSNYSKEYFQDILFYLSKRIDGRILMDSDIKDITFFIKKYNEEMQSQQNNAPGLDF